MGIALTLQNYKSPQKKWEFLYYAHLKTWECCNAALILVASILHLLRSSIKHRTINRSTYKWKSDLLYSAIVREVPSGHSLNACLSSAHLANIQLNNLQSTLARVTSFSLQVNGSWRTFSVYLLSFI